MSPSISHIAELVFRSEEWHRLWSGSNSSSLAMAKSLRMLML